MKRSLIIIFLSAALLLLLGGIGAVVYFSVREGGFGFSGSFVSVSKEETKTFKVDAKKPVVLTINDDAGDITVSGGDVKTVEVKIVKTGNASSQSRAEEDLKNIHYEIQQDGNSITLLYDLNEAKTGQIDTVDFFVTVPAESSADITASTGRIEVADLKGNVTIDSDFGDVTVKNIEGALSLENSSGTIDIHELDAAGEDVKIAAGFGGIKLEHVRGGDITVRSSSGKLEFTDVHAGGDFFAESDFGDISYKNGSSESLTVQSSSGKVTLSDVAVDAALTISCDFGELVLDQAFAGSYHLDSNSGSIVITGAKNRIKAHTDFGSITISGAQNATLDLNTNSGRIDFTGSLGKGPHVLKSDFGEIALTLPADTKIDVDLKTDFGDIESDLPITSVSAGSAAAEESHIVGNINGGGSSLTAVTNSGRISIKTLDK